MSKSSKNPIFIGFFEQQAKKQENSQKKSNNFGTCNHNLSCKKYPEVLPLFWGCFFLVSVFVGFAKLNNITTQKHSNKNKKNTKNQQKQKSAWEQQKQELELQQQRQWKKQHGRRRTRRR